MYKKVLGMFLMGTLFFFCSCVDDTYDLANKEISTDVEIKGNRLALPLGSLRAIMLDSIISVEDIDLLDKMDGVYSISMADTIAPYEYEMPEIKLQRVLRNINPAILVNTMSYSELVNTLVSCIATHIHQFHIEA